MGTRRRKGLYPNRGSKRARDPSPEEIAELAAEIRAEWSVKRIYNGGNVPPIDEARPPAIRVISTRDLGLGQNGALAD